MTAEQLGELQSLKDRLGKDVFYGEERLYNMSKHNPLHLEAINTLYSLARRVLAAEKLVEALEEHAEHILLHKDIAATLYAYREASK